jgi:hypothetical protein
MLGNTATRSSRGLSFACCAVMAVVGGGGSGMSWRTRLVDGGIFAWSGCVFVEKGSRRFAILFDDSVIRCATGGLPPSSQSTISTAMVEAGAGAGVVLPGDIGGSTLPATNEPPAGRSFHSVAGVGVGVGVLPGDVLAPFLSTSLGGCTSVLTSTGCTAFEEPHPIARGLRPTVSVD